MSMDNREEYYPQKLGKIRKSWKTLKYCNDGSSDCLEIITNSFDAGQLRIKLGYKPNIVMCDLELCYGDLKELDSNNRDSIKKIDLSSRDYDYSFNEIVDELNHEIGNYKYIRIWTKHKSVNDYLLPYYFINKFYTKLKNKEVRIIYMDELENRNSFDELLNGEFEKLMKTEKIMSFEEVKQYKEQWNNIKNKKCDIRNLKDGKLIFNNFEDYFDSILELLAQHKEITRKRFFCDLLNNNILYGTDLIVHNHIIDLMIEKNLINSKNYKITQFLPEDKISVIKKENK